MQNQKHALYLHPQSGTTEVDLKKQKNNGSVVQLVRIHAVSYTHLDVYKRQIDECFYGSPIRSALIKLAENSRQEVEWSTRLPEEGKYEVFFYHAAFARFNDDAKQLELHYIVFDGKEEHDVIATLTPKATRCV